jgi:hypothetical protein
MKRSTNPLRLVPLLACMLAPLVLSGALACGSDEDSRGLQPSHETSTPASEAEDAMTEKERRSQEAREEQAAEAEALERAQE